MKGFGSALVSRTKRLMAAWRSSTDRKTPRMSRLLVELGEESLDRIEPRCGGRSEVEGPAGVSGKPFTHFGMFMGSVVIDDGMERWSRLSEQNFRVDK